LRKRGQRTWVHRLSDGRRPGEADQTADRGGLRGHDRGGARQRVQGTEASVRGARPRSHTEQRTKPLQASRYQSKILQEDNGAQSAEAVQLRVVCNFSRAARRIRSLTSDDWLDTKQGKGRKRRQ